MLARFGRSLLLIALLAGSAWACCMIPKTFAGKVQQSAQQVVVLHGDGHQELVIRVAPRFVGTKAGAPYCAWVLTVPATPTKYAVSDAQVFDHAAELFVKLHALARAQKPKPLFTEGGGKAKSAAAVPAGVEVGRKVRVGPYDITEVKATGAQAVEGLNRYIAENGFPAEPPGELSYFAENGFTFLCIKIMPPAGETVLPPSLEGLPALRVGFPSARPYYPGKYSARQGAFALDLIILSAKALDGLSFGLNMVRLGDNPGGLRNLWSVQPLPGKLREAVDGTKLQAVPRWYVNRIQSPGFNKGDRAIAHWKTDMFFELGGPNDEPPTWYYGDGPQPVGTTAIFIAGGLVVVLAAVGVVWWLRRKNDGKEGVSD